MPTTLKHVAIIGGGLAGLTAAYRLQQAGVPYTLLESSPRLGGKLLTRRAHGYTMEIGADAILTRKPWAMDLAKELGLEPRIIYPAAHKTNTWVLHKGKPVPLPDGLQLLVPTKFLPFLRSPLFTVAGKLRALAEVLIPRRTETTDESLADFIRRRLGREMLDKVADPMLAGVYNGESERQSILATFPQFPALEREHRSLIEGLRATQKKTPPTATPAPAFFSFMNGTQELADTLAAKLTGTIHLNSPVTALVHLRQDNTEYRLTTSTGQQLSAGALILTTPAHIAAQLLSEVAPVVAATLKELRHTGIATAYLAYRRSDVPHALDGFGLVIPPTERRRIDGMMWSSSKWPDRAPEGTALLRLFFGGPHTRNEMHLSDPDALEMCKQELRSILDITAEPIHAEVHRWPDSYPQYDLGHLNRIQQIESNLPPTIHLAGCPYKGIGIPDCVRTANEAVAKLLA